MSASDRSRLFCNMDTPPTNPTVLCFCVFLVPGPCQVLSLPFSNQNQLGTTPLFSRLSQVMTAVQMGFCPILSLGPNPYFLWTKPDTDPFLQPKGVLKSPIALPNWVLLMSSCLLNDLLISPFCITKRVCIPHFCGPNRVHISPFCGPKEILSPLSSRTIRVQAPIKPKHFDAVSF